MKEDELTEEEILEILGGAEIKPADPVICEYKSGAHAFCYASSEEKLKDCAGKKGLNGNECQYFGAKWYLQNEN